MLAQALLGRHPHTGEQLVAATGSAGRAASRRSSKELLTVADVAEELGVSTQRVGQLVAAGTRRAELTAAGEDPSSVSSWLTGHKHGRQWRFEPDEVERHARTRTLTRTTPRPNRAPEGELTVAEVAETLGVSPQQVRALAATGAKRQELLDNGEDVDHIAQWLTGRKNAKQWRFDPAEIARAANARTVPRVVVAYDFTLSVEKSISLTWVHADTEQRAVIEDALRHGVQAGVSHLEDHGLAVRRDRGANTADGMWAASYLHLTNRNLEPQLHVHTVIVNVAADATTGHTQTIDGRGLFREVTAAGYLAGAEIRAHLADRLGLAWDRAHKGTMEVAGVPDTAITVTSTRRAEVIALADELGYGSAKSRQIAALSTRAPKQHPEDFDDLVESWQSLLAAHGFGPADADAILNSRVVRTGVEAECLVRADAATEMVGRDHAATGPQVAAGPAATSPGPDAATGYRRYTQLPDAPGPVLGLDAAQTADLFVWLGSPAGLTRSSGVFARSDIVEAVVTWDADHGGGTRLRAAPIQDIADRVMGGAGIGSRFDDHVLPITVPSHLAQRSAGRQWLTTESMLAIETAVIDAYRNGHGAITGIGPEHAQQSTARWQASTGNRLGGDQAAMIATVTSGGDRFGLVVGPAGTGKTAALEVACRAWENAGLTPVGLAVTGSATDTLAASTGIDTSTVASILARDSSGLGSGFRSDTVVVVDEASMLSNRGPSPPRTTRHRRRCPHGRRR